MKLYHGSKMIVERPQFGLGKLENDYGRGFYCTEHLELAKEWACPKKEDGFANCYELNTKGLKILDLNGEGFGVMEWLYVLIVNRPVRLESPIQVEGREWIKKHFAIATEEYDVIRGYRADDSYFGFVRSFLENGISLAQLTRAMRLGNLGEQIMIKSEKAFSALKFKKSEIASWLEYHLKRASRDEAARREFAKEAGNRASEGLFMMDILRAKMERGDARLR